MPKVADPGAVAGHVRRLRQDRGWTQRALADAAGLSKAYLSRVESGERQPSLAALLSLAGALDVSVGALFGETGGVEDAVIRPADRREHEGNGLRYRVPSGQAGGGALQAIAVTVPAGREGGERYGHAGEEWLRVLSGRLRLTLGDEVAVLEPGDAAHFDATVPHRLDAEGADDVELLLVAAAARPGLLASYVAPSVP